MASAMAGKANIRSTNQKKTMEDFISSDFGLTNLNKIFKLGSSRPLTNSDLGALPLRYSAHVAGEDFNTDQLMDGTQTFWKSLWRSTGYREPILSIICSGVSAASGFAGPLILKALMQHFSGVHVLSTGLLWTIVALILVVPIVGSIALARSSVISIHLGLKLRNGVMAAIYRKALKLDTASRQNTPSGQIINMYNVDIRFLEMMFMTINAVIWSPIQIAVALALIYYEVGAVMFVSCGFIFMLLPLLGMTASNFGVYIGRKSDINDKRIKLINEVLTGIRMVKYYCWETAFEAKIGEIRATEIVEILNIYLVWIGLETLLALLPCALPVLLFLAYVGTGHALPYATAFTTLTLFNLLQVPFYAFPDAVSQLAQLLVACERLSKFFMNAEVASYVQPMTEADDIDNLGKQVVIQLTHASLGWLTEDSTAAATAPVTSAEEGHAAGDPASHDYEKVATIALPELPEPALAEAPHAQYEEAAAVAVTGVNRSVQTLQDLSLTVTRGELVAVVGAVGSGKSSLLCALLGELQLQSGTVHMNGPVAYHQQNPWVRNATVKDNILLGAPYDAERFEAAIQAACLEADIITWAAGINTEIGERGINLSGGQKARVSFARTVYRDASVYLLDDPLSAIDAHVGDKLFHKGIREQLRGARKTVILVTHQVHFLGECDKVVVMEDGAIKAVGSYEEVKEIVAKKIKLDDDEDEEDDRDVDVDEGEAVDEFEVNRDVIGVEQVTVTGAGSADVPVSTDHTPDSSPRLRGRTTSNDVTPRRRLRSSSEAIGGTGTGSVGGATPRKRLPSSDHTSTTSKPHKTHTAEDDIAELAAGQLMTEEERKEGIVLTEVYSYYITSGGPLLFAAIFMLSVIGRTCGVLSTFWLAYWGGENLRAARNGTTLSTRQNLHFLGTFAALFFMTAVCNCFQSIIASLHGVRASRQLHEQLLKAVLGSPISFFDTTPLGRVLNRFSSDIAISDMGLAAMVSLAIISSVDCVSVLCAVVVATKGTFLALLLPLGVFYRQVQTYYRASNTELKRLESISKSPLLAEFSQSLAGVTSIRAYQETPAFIAMMETFIDQSSNIWALQRLSDKWLAIRLDAFGSVVAFFVAVLAVAAPVGFVPTGSLATALTYAFLLPRALGFSIGIVSQVEAMMSSVERVKHYVDTLEQEEGPKSRGLQKDALDGAERVVDETGIEMGHGTVNSRATLQIAGVTDSGSLSVPPPDWPSLGAITVKDISLCYGTGPLVLKNLSFSVNAQEKLGIAGRTGCGKSSLIAALFRIEKLQTGSICIDGLDIALMPLSSLRSKLCIIPQDPVLFSASLRFNIDPFAQSCDEDVWQALEEVQMKAAVMNLPAKLDEEVAEGGENFSAGQRQLLCIARALLRRPKILVMDEATAAVDNDTDEIIQRMIRTRFKDCTILTIAHRLHTIIDSDRIMVLDHGSLLEMDSPANLLKEEAGAFAKLWSQHQKGLSAQ